MSAALLIHILVVSNNSKAPFLNSKISLSVKKMFGISFSIIILVEKKFSCTILVEPLICAYVGTNNRYLKQLDKGSSLIYYMMIFTFVSIILFIPV